MFGTRSLGKVYNFVHADEIWKDHVALEFQSQKRWSDQWGYLLEEYEKLQASLLDPGVDIEGVSDTKKEDQLTETGGDAAITSTPGTVEFKIDQLSTDLGRLLQSNARGKNDIIKLLKWPREGL